jgi:ABC-type Na+ transport system ATPase subunit NatA
VSAIPAAPTCAASAIRLEGLTKRFGPIVAVDHLSLTVAAGEVFGFLGPNGAGKSTTIRVLLGLLRPTAGTATVFGVNASDVRLAHRHLAYVPADVALWPALTGAEILELLGNIGPSVDLTYRAELVDRFDLDLDRPAKTYSTGNRQKVALIAAFATRAPLLVLDEPTSGLDPLMEREFRRCVSEARQPASRSARRDRHHRRSPTAAPNRRRHFLRRHQAGTGERAWRVRSRASRRSTAAVQPFRITRTGTAGTRRSRHQHARDA